MLVGVIIGMSALFFLDNTAMLILLGVPAAAVFAAGLIYNLLFVRCPHCGYHPGKIMGVKCPHCGKNLEE